MRTECIMVIDFGTSNVRTNLINIESGEVLFGYSKPVFYSNVKLDFHEINVDNYWLSSVETTRKVINQIDNTIVIKGLIFSYIGDSMVPVDSKGDPVYNMIASFDIRAKNDMQLYTDILGVERFEEISGCPLTPRNTGVKISWLKKYMPTVKKKAAYYLTLQQFINMKLGLGPISDFSVANRKLMLDVQTKRWSKELMQLINSNVKEQGEEILGGDVQIGKIKQYGDVRFPYEIPVFPGGHDSAVGFFGLGLSMDEEKILGNVGGTFDHYGFLRSYYINTLKKARVQTVAGPTSESYVTIKAHPAGKDLLWFLREIVENEDSKLLNNYFNKSKFDASNNMFYSAKMDVEKGAFINMGITSGRQQIFDTLVEGMTFLSKSIVEEFSIISQKKIDIVRVGGGSGKSDQWLQLKANIFDCKVEKVKNLEVSSVGAAIIACVGLGIYTYNEAFGRMIQVEKEFNPDLNLKNRYKERYLSWKKIFNN